MDRLCQPPSDDERRANTQAIHKLSIPNRFRLMFGQPLFPDSMSLSTSLLGPYDDVSTGDKTIVSAAIPPDVKERLFVDLLPRRGSVDKLIARQLHRVDAYFCVHPELASLTDDMKEKVVNTLLNCFVDMLDELDPKQLVIKSNEHDTKTSPDRDA